MKAEHYVMFLGAIFVVAAASAVARAQGAVLGLNTALIGAALTVATHKVVNG